MEFHTVRVLLELRNLSTLRNIGIPRFRGFDCTYMYVKVFETKRSVHNIIDVHFSGVPLNSCIAMIITYTGKGLNEATWCEFVEEAGIKTSDCMNIAKKLGFKVECNFSANDLCRQWGTDASWQKLGEALETIDEYKDKSQKVKDKEAETGLLIVKSMFQYATGALIILH